MRLAVFAAVAAFATACAGQVDDAELAVSQQPAALCSHIVCADNSAGCAAAKSLLCRKQDATWGRARRRVQRLAGLNVSGPRCSDRMPNVLLYSTAGIVQRCNQNGRFFKDGCSGGDNSTVGYRIVINWERGKGPWRYSLGYLLENRHKLNLVRFFHWCSGNNVPENQVQEHASFTGAGASRWHSLLIEP